MGAAVVPAWPQHLCAVWDVAAGWQQENAGIHWGPLYWEKWAEEKGWSLWKPPTTVPGITHPPEMQQSPQPWLEGVTSAQAGCSQRSPVKSPHHRDLRDPTSLAKGPCPSDCAPGSKVFCCADPGLAGVCPSSPCHSFGCWSLGLVFPIDPALLPASPHQSGAALPDPHCWTGESFMM